MLSRVVFAVSCVIVPIVWGIIVNWIFRRLRRRWPRNADTGADSGAQDDAWIEYHI